MTETSTPVIGTRTASSGFTLIELMITVVIIGVLAAIAWPSYQGFVEQGRRSDGQGALMDTAQALERCYTTYGAYDDTDCDVTFPRDSSEGHYEITAPTLSDTTFTLEATPQGVQASDDCGDLTLAHTGAKGSDGTDCW